MATENNNLSKYDKSKIPDSSNYRFGIVVSEWNPTVTNGLLQGAVDTLTDCGVAFNHIETIKVPGSFELIYASKLMQQRNVDAVIAIGCVIQGETKHFDFVCDGVTQGIKDLNILHDTPVVFCVLTDNTLQQSIDRSGGKHGNKGEEAAITAIKMAELKHLK